MTIHPFASSLTIWENRKSIYVTTSKQEDHKVGWLSESECLRSALKLIKFSMLPYSCENTSKKIFIYINQLNSSLFPQNLRSTSKKLISYLVSKQLPLTTIISCISYISKYNPYHYTKLPNYYANYKQSEHYSKTNMIDDYFIWGIINENTIYVTFLGFTTESQPIVIKKNKNHKELLNFKKRSEQAISLYNLHGIKTHHSTTSYNDSINLFFLDKGDLSDFSNHFQKNSLTFTQNLLNLLSSHQDLFIAITPHELSNIGVYLDSSDFTQIYFRNLELAINLRTLVDNLGQFIHSLNFLLKNDSNIIHHFPELINTPTSLYHTTPITPIELEFFFFFKKYLPQLIERHPEIEERELIYARSIIINIVEKTLNSEALACKEDLKSTLFKDLMESFFPFIQSITNQSLAKLIIKISLYSATSLEKKISTIQQQPSIISIHAEKTFNYESSESQKKRESQELFKSLKDTLFSSLDESKAAKATKLLLDMLSKKTNKGPKELLSLIES